MAKNIIVNINNGYGTKEIPNGEYSVTAEATGYDNQTLTPSSVTITDETETYEFKLSATGNLIMHVTEEGTQDGTPVVGATFYRCDSTGTTYGEAITTDSQGIATLPNLPYAQTNAPTVYYKQTTTDDSHNFDETLKSITLTEITTTIQIQNAKAITKTILLSDTNYDGLKIETAQMTISN